MDACGEANSQNFQQRYHAEEVEERFGRFKPGVIRYLCDFFHRLSFLCHQYMERSLCLEGNHQYMGVLQPHSGEYASVRSEIFTGISRVHL